LYYKEPDGSQDESGSVERVDRRGFSKISETFHRFIDNRGNSDYDPEFSAPRKVQCGEGVAAVKSLGLN
jgi:hypothetical protein